MQRTIFRIGATFGWPLLPLLLAAPRASADEPKLHAGAEITVVVDNRASQKGFQTSWGFACVVRGFKKTILFDTGKEGAVLMANLQKLEIDPGEIEAVVLSHAHRDHTGGLDAFLSVNHKVTVYLLSSFPQPMVDAVRASGAEVVSVSASMEICPNVHSTGSMGQGIPEQSLVLRTGSGLVVLTGCAHPGIVNILCQVEAMFPRDDRLLVIGGFHLMKATGLKRIASHFRKSKVGYVAPLHCTGMRAKSLFRQIYQERSIDVRVGETVVIPKKPEKLCGRKVCLRSP